MADDVINVYRGQDGAIDYDTPVAVMDLDDTSVDIPDHDLPPGTIWHYVRRQKRDCCEMESSDSPLCIVQIDAAGEMMLDVPNVPQDVQLELLAGAKLRLRWRYSTAGQAVSPTGFKVFITDGLQIDWDTWTATVAYNPGVGEYSWTSGQLTHGTQYRLAVRSYKTGAAESQNTKNYVAVADQYGPDAITDLHAEIET